MPVPQRELRTSERRMTVLDWDAGLQPTRGADAATRHSRPLLCASGAATGRPRRRWASATRAGSGCSPRRPDDPHAPHRGAQCCELLGPGDMFRPWDREDDLPRWAGTVSWRAIEETASRSSTTRSPALAGRWPEVLAALMQRGLRRSRSLAVLLAIAQARRADVRLMALFWHLADRWGRVTSDGVVIELELTHGLLSTAHQPSAADGLGHAQGAARDRRADPALEVVLAAPRRPAERAPADDRSARGRVTCAPASWAARPGTTDHLAAVRAGRLTGCARREVPNGSRSTSRRGWPRRAFAAGAARLGRLRRARRSCCCSTGR